MNKFLIQVFGKKPTKFSIVALKNQTRNQLKDEVDNIVGHLNYGAENYHKDIFTAGCFGWVK